jgi:hypothetical protein
MQLENKFGKVRVGQPIQVLIQTIHLCHLSKLVRMLMIVMMRS